MPLPTLSGRPAPGRFPNLRARCALLLAALRTWTLSAPAAAQTAIAPVGGGAIEFRYVPPAPGTAPAGTVVFENGLRADIDGWSAAHAGLAPATRQGWALFAYNRPGIIKKPEDFPVTARIAKSLFMSRMAARETEAIHATSEQVLALPWPAQIRWSG